MVGVRELEAVGIVATGVVGAKAGVLCGRAGGREGRALRVGCAASMLGLGPWPVVGRSGNRAQRPCGGDQVGQQ